MEQQIQATNNQLALATDAASKTRLQTKITSYQQIYSVLLQSYEQVRLTDAQTISSICKLNRLLTPLLPIRPIRHFMLLWWIVAFLFTAGLILGVDQLDDTFKAPEEISQTLGLPILGIIPHYKNNNESRQIIETQPKSRISKSVSNFAYKYFLCKFSNE